MMDVREPKNPKFVGCFADPRTGRSANRLHARCAMRDLPRAGRRVQGPRDLPDGSETALGVADVTDKARPRTISVATYPNVGYSHQGWLADDHHYFYMDDELDELIGTAPKTRTIVWDLADLDDPCAPTMYGTTAATDHNLYIKGDTCISPLRGRSAGRGHQGSHETGGGGLLRHGAVRREQPGFGGSWSNYPYFKSGIVAVSSMREGLFLVRYQPSTVVP